MKRIQLILCFVSILSGFNVHAFQATSNTVTTEDSWEVEIVEKNSNLVVKTQIVPENVIILEGLASDVEYFARIRTKNFVCSGWVNSDVFTFVSTGNKAIPDSKLIAFSIEKGRMLIIADSKEQVKLYSTSGKLVRSVDLSSGKTLIEGLSTGVYVVGNLKVAVK